jgi:hypothetical protein
MVLEKALESSDADVACLHSTFLDWPKASSLAQLEGWQLAQDFTKLYPILTGQIFPGFVFESCVYRISAGTKLQLGSARSATG